MKKVLFVAFVAAVTLAWPTDAKAADNCGCDMMDVVCVNQCTLKKVTAFKQNIQTKHQDASKKVKAAQAKAQAKGSGRSI